MVTLYPHLATFYPGYAEIWDRSCRRHIATAHRVRDTSEGAYLPRPSYWVLRRPDGDLIDYHEIGRYSHVCRSSNGLPSGVAQFPTRTIAINALVALFRQ